MRYVLIKDGIVTNSVEWDGVPYNAQTNPNGWQIPANHQAIQSDVAGTGWTYVDGEFVQPEKPAPEIVIPDSVSRRQFMLQLAIAGLTTEVNDWISSQDELVQIAFNESGSFVRTEPMMQQGLTGLGFTSEQIDDFFLAASQL